MLGRSAHRPPFAQAQSRQPGDHDTVAGCNALDYLLDGPAEIHTIDVNPRQNAVLELKLALIRQGDFGNLFEFFRHRSHEDYQAEYRAVRPGTRILLYFTGLDLSFVPADACFGALLYRAHRAAPPH